MKTEVSDFSAGDFDALDEAEMVVMVRDKPTTWRWTFAGPGHPKAVAQSERLSRDRLQRDRQQEAARVNGKKWKGDDESVEEVRSRNIRWVVERIVGWSPVRIDGADLPFTAEAATRLLADPRKGDLLVQALDFLAAGDSFTKRSATS